MKTSIQQLAIIGLISFTMFSCTTEDTALIAPASQVLEERIDLVIEGETTDYIYLQNAQEDASADLVSYNQYGANVNQVDFRIDLGNDRMITFKVTNGNLSNPWQYENIPYDLFSPQDIEDKLKYVFVTYTEAGQTIAYASHFGNNLPRGTYLNVFRIENYDPMNQEILCRINDLTLTHVSQASSKDITINGTFRGSLSDLN